MTDTRPIQESSPSISDTESLQEADGMLADALELLPRDSQGLEYGADGFGPASLTLVLVGGPQAAVLRPSELDSKELQEHLGKLALFGETRIFAAEHGITPYTDDGNALVLFQEGRQVCLSEDGSIQLVAPFPQACTDAFDDPSVLITLEEDVCGLIAGFLKFSSVVLDLIDEAECLAHVAVAVRALGVGDLAWKTRKAFAEATARQGAAMGVQGQGERAQAKYRAVAASDNAHPDRAPARPKLSDESAQGLFQCGSRSHRVHLRETADRFSLIWTTS